MWTPGVGLRWAIAEIHTINRLRYQDKPLISFIDLTSMAIIEEFGVKEVLTEDDHFAEVGMAAQRIP